MPSALAEPTLAELLRAFEDGVRVKDPYADVREGAVYQHWGGVAAILWSRIARGDTDLWRAIYLDSAEARDLTNLLSDRYDFDRQLDTRGPGTALLQRPTADAGAGTVWVGTRLLVGSAASEPKRFRVTGLKEVDASDLAVEVAIEAERPGAGTAVDFSSGDADRFARIDDPLWDATWTVSRLTCADGTSFESAPQARARLREARRVARAGFVDAITQACIDAGASHALLFPSDYAGTDEDIGLNMAYVGDGGFQGSDTLVREVILALESWRVLGDNLQVRPLSRSDLTIRANVYLWESPARVNQPELQKQLKGAILGYFDGATGGFSYQLDTLVGAMLGASGAVQWVEFETPTSDAGVMQTIGGRLNFPATLNRYRVQSNDITLALLPPQ